MELSTKLCFHEKRAINIPDASQEMFVRFEDLKQVFVYLEC